MCVCVYIFIYIYTDWNPPAFENHLEMNFALFLLTISKSVIFRTDILPIPSRLLPPSNSPTGSSSVGRSLGVLGTVGCFYFGDLGGMYCSFPLRRVTP